MMNLFKCAPQAMLACLLVLSGCSQVQGLWSPDYYQLSGFLKTSSQPASTTGKPDLRLVVGPISLADYLRQDALIQRQSDGTLKVDSRARWSAGLDQEVSQVLMSQLSGKLQRASLSPYRYRPANADLQLVLSISRLDSGPVQPAVLQANWQLLDNHGKQKAADWVQLQVRHNGQLSDQVRAQSQLLAQLADNLGGVVQRVQHQLLTARQPAVKAASKSPPKVPASPAPGEPDHQPEQAPVMPVLPQPGPGEVLRF